MKSLNFAITLLMIWSYALVIAHDYKGVRKPATTHKPIMEFEVIESRELSRSPAITLK